MAEHIEQNDLEQENRFKVVEIEKYQEIIEDAQREIKDYTFWMGFSVLGLIAGICRISFGEDIYYYGTLAVISGFYIMSNMKSLIKNIVIKTIAEQKLMDIESDIDARIEEVFYNIQLEVDKVMKNEMDGGKQR